MTPSSIKPPIFWAVAAAAAGYGVYRLIHVPRLAPVPAARPARTFDEAVRRAHTLQAQDGDQVTPPCRTKILTHDHKTPRAFVLLHGFTNCPEQFGAMAADLHAAGHNVIVPRYAYHGLARMSTDIRHLKAEQLVQAAATAVDIACGLGDQVTVLGLSLGGLLTTWLAMHHPGIDHAVVIAPALATQAVRPQLTRLYVGVLRHAPNVFRWWDPLLRADVPGAAHAYPRLSTRAFAQLLRLGFVVAREAASARPIASRVTLVLNPRDEQIDNELARAVFQHWRDQGAPVAIYAFPPELGLIHDLIDPTQPLQQVDKVYPSLYAIAAQQSPELLRTME